MIVAGCLLLVILPLAGLALGGLAAGPEGARIGAAIGLALALLACGLSGYALVKVARRK